MESLEDQPRDTLVHYELGQHELSDCEAYQCFLSHFTAKPPKHLRRIIEELSWSTPGVIPTKTYPNIVPAQSKPLYTGPIAVSAHPQPSKVDPIGVKVQPDLFLLAALPHQVNLCLVQDLIQIAE